MTLYLTRLRKARSPAHDALSALLDPDDEAQRLDADHRLLWSAFATDPKASRDFLWRAETPSGFLVLSARKPETSPFFEPPETRPFAPDLRRGDRLAFQLRVNATRDRSGVTKQRRVDIVMDALHDVPGPDRASARLNLAHGAASDWLARQGDRNGFTPEEISVEDYSVLTLPSMSRRRGQPRFGVLDLTGRLNVTDPEAFIARLGVGFGRAKAFGCGLMLIRRD